MCIEKLLSIATDTSTLMGLGIGLVSGVALQSFLKKDSKIENWDEVSFSVYSFKKPLLNYSWLISYSN